MAQTFFGSNKQQSKKFKIKDDELLGLVQQDIEAAEDYFDSNIKPAILTRYNLVHSNKGYYADKFKKLSQKSDFSTTDIKDAIEWQIPSLMEIVFGADKIVGILGRTPDDKPEALEKLIEFQIKTLNDGYKILGQWFRDPLEAGLGVLECSWRRKENKEKVTVTVPEDLFLQIPDEKILKSKDNGDGTIDVKLEKTEVIKNQPVIENLMPGEWIYLPEKDLDGVSVFEARRRFMLKDDLLQLEKEGYYKNVKDIDFSASGDSMSDSASSLTEIAEAIANYTGERTEKNPDTQDDGKGVNRREKVLVYKCFGKYDVDGDGIEEYCEIHICGGVILRKEINIYERPLFFDCSAFDKSYVRWKEAVADVLQDIQDLRTALFRQIIINTAMNNDRPIVIDKNQKQGIQDAANSKKVIRIDKKNGSLKDFIEFASQIPLAKETFPLLEMLQGLSEQRSGVTRYNQGLDADSLNKTATGISKIMAASQQKLRMVARNIAETGLVPLYRFLVELNQRHLDQELIVRLTGEYHTIHPDDLKGQFDTEIVSNIGLQDTQLTIQNLMIMFSQIIPTMVKMGVATPLGVYNTAVKLIEEMGFSDSSEFIGQSQDELKQRMQQEDAMSQLPMLLGGAMKQAGMNPEQAAGIVQTVMSAFQPANEENQEAA